MDKPSKMKKLVTRVGNRERQRKHREKLRQATPAPGVAASSRLGSIDRTIEEALSGENVDDLLSHLSPGDIDLFHRIVADIRTGGTVDELDELWRIDYTRKLPTMEEFVENDYWLGQVLRKSEDTKGLLPVWKNVLTRDFNVSSRINNVVLTGSLGTGKTYIAVIIFLYRVVCARLLRNPQAFFGLSKGSAIYYVILSITKQTVSDTAWSDAKNFMSYSPFFIEECGFDPEAVYASLKIGLGNGINLSAGSKGWHIIGRNAMGVVLDEGNFRQEANPDLRAYELYDEARTRIQNRFQRIKGFLPAISILASSARDETSFTEHVIHDIEELNDEKIQRVYRYAIYEVKMDELNFGDEWFKVAYGLRSLPPVVLQGVYRGDGTPLRGEPGYEQAPEGSKVKLVPYLYHDAFMRNVKVNLQSICGVSIGGSDKWFGSMADVEHCYALSDRDGLVSPCRLDSIPLSEEDDREIWDSLDHKTFLTKREGQVIPKRHPEALRYAHLDLATQSMAGISVCHRVGQQLVDGLVKDGKVYSEYRVIVEYDFILTIVAGSQRPISLEKIQKFFFWLNMQCGYRFGIVTADQFQSALPLQMLESRGFKTAHLSVDRKKDQYLAWRNAFEELRLRLYRQPWLDREIHGLIDTGSKVDHPSDGSKDTADGACGAYWNAISTKDVAVSPYSAEPSIYANDAVDLFNPPPPVEINVGMIQREEQRSFSG